MEVHKELSFCTVVLMSNILRLLARRVRLYATFCRFKLLHTTLLHYRYTNHRWTLSVNHLVVCGKTMFWIHSKITLLRLAIYFLLYDVHSCCYSEFSFEAVPMPVVCCCRCKRYFKGCRKNSRDYPTRFLVEISFTALYFILHVRVLSVMTFKHSPLCISYLSVFCNEVFYSLFLLNCHTRWNGQQNRWPREEYWRSHDASRCRRPWKMKGPNYYNNLLNKFITIVKYHICLF